MLICIPEVLTKEQAAHCRKVMDRAEWVDGRVTAGAQSGSVKHNNQLPEGSPAANQLGDMVLYPSTSLHHVKPVTRGARVASFFWLQSMVREDSARSLLFDLDQTIQELSAERGVEDAACIRLTGIYHNLIRYWADA